MSDHFDTFAGLNVSILGDITHSRVARSNIFGLKALGANVTLCGPRTLLPVGIERLGVRVTHRLDEALDGCDVAMALRIQLERQGSSLFPSLREYHEQFGVKLEHLERYPDLLIMHPGPVNRGVELASEVVDHERAIILNQVTNGVAVRMAVLYLLAGLSEPGTA
jgi:aspartate carbamoyltransferase catalytic subunit